MQSVAKARPHSELAREKKIKARPPIRWRKQEFEFFQMGLDHEYGTAIHGCRGEGSWAL